jgi:hypothetical protein
MPNSLTSNPWVIDTPGAAILFAGDVYIEHMEWSQYQAAATCTVQDRFGKVIWQPGPASDLEEVRTGKVEKVHGISVPTLSSGKLWVYFK